MHTALLLQGTVFVEISYWLLPLSCLKNIVTLRGVFRFTYYINSTYMYIIQYAPLRQQCIIRYYVVRYLYCLCQCIAFSLSFFVFFVFCFPDVYRSILQVILCTDVGKFIPRLSGGLRAVVIRRQGLCTSVTGEHVPGYIGERARPTRGVAKN